MQKNSVATPSTTKHPLPRLSQYEVRVINLITALENLSPFQLAEENSV